MRVLVLALIFCRISWCQIPVNDAFASRISLSGSAVVATSDNTNASLEPGEPSHPNSAGSSLWWSWVAPADGWLTIDTSSNVFTPSFAVYTGSNLTSLTLVANCDLRCPMLDYVSAPVVSTNEIFHVSANQPYQLAFSSPFNPYDSTPPDESPSGPFGFSLLFSTLEILSPTNTQRTFTGANVPVEVAFQDATNTVAQITLELDGVLQNLVATPSASDARHLSFSMTALPAGPHSIRAKLTHTDDIVHWTPKVMFSVVPPNDDFTNAIAVTGMNVTDYGDIANAGPEPGELFNPRSVGSSIWYRWLPPTNGVARIAVSSDFLAVSVQRRDSSGGLEMVAINYSVPSWYEWPPMLPVLQFAAEQSTEYYIQFSARSVEFAVGPSYICEPPRPTFPRPFSFTIDLVAGVVRQPEFLMEPGLPPISSDTVHFLFAAPAKSRYSIFRSIDLVIFEPAFEGVASGGCEYVTVPADFTAAGAFYFLSVTP